MHLCRYITLFCLRYLIFYIGSSWIRAAWVGWGETLKASLSDLPFSAPGAEASYILKSSVR